MSLRVGGIEVDEQDAEALVHDYVTRGTINGYPSYDRFDSGVDRTAIVEADLLVPSLLNAPVGLREFVALKEIRGELQDRLLDIPPDADLTDAKDTDLEALRNLFAVLDRLMGSGVGPAKFTKILHRKRPGFIPIIDINVLWCYQAQPDAAQSRVPPVRGRSWATFAPLLATAIRDDLLDASHTWTRLGELAVPPLSRLRALDIVAWRVGNHPRHPSDAVARD